MTPKGGFTENALFWARKTEGLSDEEWRRAFEQVEHRVKDAARIGEKCYPPSYAAFLAYSKPASRAHKHFKPLALPSDEAKEKARIAAERELDKMKSLFE